MQRSIISFAGISVAIVVAASCATTPPPLDRVGVAFANVAGPAGEPRGTAQFWQGIDNVVRVEVQLTGLPPGSHGIHFHEVGACDGSGATAFSSAGAHYNPLGRQHGLDNSQGPHGGDAPNFTVGSDGKGTASFTTNRISLTDGSTSLFDSDGSSIVVHAAADDQISQPSGNSGARIACGVVKRQPAT